MGPKKLTKNGKNDEFAENDKSDEILLYKAVDKII